MPNSGSGRPSLELLTGHLDDLGPWVVVLVNAVTKPHQAETGVLVFGHLDELVYVTAIGLDAFEHFENRFVGTTVQGSPQGVDTGRNTGEQVGMRAADHSHGGCAAVFVRGQHEG